MTTGKPFTRLWAILRSERQEVRSIYTFAIFQGIVGLSLPLGIQAIINFLQAGRLSTSWYVLVGFVLLGILLAGLLQLKQLAVTETIEQRLFVNTAFEYSLRLPRVSIGAVEKQNLPEMVNRFFEVGTVQKGLSKMLIDFSTAAIQIIFGLLVLSFYHPFFIFFSLALLALLYSIFRWTGPGGLRTSMEESKYKFAVAHWLQETARAMSTFKLTGATDLPNHKTDELTRKYLNARFKHFLILMTQYRALIVFKMLVAAALIIVGSILVINQQINIGQFVAAEIIVLLVLSSVEKLILSIGTVYDVLTALEKLGSVTDLPLERSNGDDIPDIKPNGLSVRLKNINFKFAEAPKPLFNDLNLEVAPGEMICILGDAGSGKTTLLRLLSGYYEVFDGSITYNDLPIGNLKLDHLRAVIGENYYEQAIFPGTVFENIACGVEGIQLADVMKAATEAGVHSIIAEWQEGYNTIIGADGKRLSDSTVHKIILARCLINQPKMLLIEDLVTHWGAESRIQFYDLLFQYKKVTTVVVTNDNELSKRFHKVYRLSNGKLELIK